MTFSLVAFCPWNAAGNAQGLIFISDCRLTGENLATGERKVISDSEPKIFELGPFAVGSYAGNQVSAGFAMRRVSRLFRKPKRQLNYKTMFGRIAKAMYDGKRQARRFAARQGQEFVGGSFIALFGYVDVDDRLNMGMMGAGEPSESFWFGGIGIYDDVRAVVVGTGGQAGSMLQFTSNIESLFRGTDLAVTLKEQELPVQASYLARSLAQLLRENPPEGCGGGVQLVTLDSQHGAASWRLWSIREGGFAMCPEGKWAPDDWAPESSWVPERPEHLATYRRRAFVGHLERPV
ncbi:MAG TPA: hypothetical protein VI876_10400 [Dehalococcoidia bacterium]|nr:hypothetical protein [Dehalococcoidia bacterium]